MEKKFPFPPEKKEEEFDIYEDRGMLSDYTNVLDYGPRVRDGKIVRQRSSLLPTLDQRYLTPITDNGLTRRENSNCNAAYWIPFFEKNPGKKERFNSMIEIVNTTDDVIRFKRAFNEILRLMYGKTLREDGRENWKQNTLHYKDPESNPDLLEI
ncbi:MAG: hypothetical protein V4674_03710 [Patescibacteria group bacterium]